MTSRVDFNGKSSKVIREDGNFFFTNFVQAHTLEEKKRRLDSALICYKEAYIVAQYASTYELGDLKSAAKNIGVCYKHLLNFETKAVTKKYYFLEGAKHFAKSIAFYAKEGGNNDSEWLAKIIQPFTGIVEEFFDYIQNFEMKTRLSLSESFLTQFNQDTTLNMERQLLASARHKQANMVFNMAVEAIGRLDPQGAANLMKEMHFPLEEAKRNALADDKDFLRELRFTQADYRAYVALSDGLHAFHVAKDLLKEAVESEENLQVEIVWQALDKFKEAALMAKGEDVEFECMAMGKIGYIYYKVLLNTPRAKTCFLNVINLAKTLERNNYEFEWYTEVADMLREIQEKARSKEELAWQKEREPLLKRLEKELKLLKEHQDKGYEALIEFLFEHLPPKHKKEYAKLKPDTKAEDIQWKKVFQKMVCYYHPDKVDKDFYGTKYFVLCEEITKVLTQKYELMKG